MAVHPLSEDALIEQPALALPASLGREVVDAPFKAQGVVARLISPLHLWSCPFASL